MAKRKQVPQWAKELWKELTTPPVWLTAPPPASGKTKGDSAYSNNYKKKQKNFYKEHAEEDEDEDVEEESEDEDEEAEDEEAAVEDQDEDEDDDTHRQRAEHRNQAPKAARDLRLIFRARGFSPTLLDMYPVEVQNATPAGAVLRLETSKGPLALKRSSSRKQHVHYMWNALQYAEKNGFSRLAAIVLNNRHLPYTAIGEKLYYASNWIPGEKADFSSMVHIGEAALSIAEFHKATRGFKSTDYIPPRSYNLSKIMHSRIKQFDTFLTKARARRKPDAIDRFVLRHAPYYKKQAQQAAALWDSAVCREFLRQDEATPALCHLDITPDNLVYWKTRMYLIDFDLIGYGPRMLDIGHLIRRSLQANQWQKDAALIALVQVNSVEPLRNAEYRLLHSLLTFPHSFWRACSVHYLQQKTPYTLANLQKLQAQEEARQDFLKDLSAHAARHRGR